MAVKNIEPELKLISDYMKLKKNERLHIPTYQRPYKWTTEQCDKLWQDIEEFIKSGAEDPYFFGTVIIDCSKEGVLSLIDGQQRTTTFMLLFKALQLRIKDVMATIPKDEDNEALMESLKDSYNTILEILYKADAEKRVEIKKDWSKAYTTIIVNESMNEEHTSELIEILKAETYAEAEAKVYKYPRRQKDYKYTNFFRNFKQFYQKLGAYGESELNKFAKVFVKKCQVIEIRSWNVEQAIKMFNSLNSTGMPLADADIISAELYPQAKDKNEFTNRWKEIRKMSQNLAQTNVIDIDGMLQQYMYIHRAKTGDYKEGEMTTPGVRSYYKNPKNNLLNNPEQLCDNFENILHTWDKIKDYPCVKLLLKFNVNSRIFLISYLDRYSVDELSEEVVRPMVACLLRLFTVMELVETGYSSSSFKTFLFNLNLAMLGRGMQMEDIERRFDEHINQCWKVDDIQSRLLEYDKNILVFLNEYLYAKEHGLGFDFKYNVNIEHIMPSSGKDIESIRKDAGIETADEFTEIVNLLGNKILLEENINKSIGNEWFRSKKSNSIINRTGYQDSRHGIALSLCRYPKDLWEKADIENATIKAAQRITNFIFNK